MSRSYISRADLATQRLDALNSRINLQATFSTPKAAVLRAELQAKKFAGLTALAAEPTMDALLISNKARVQNATDLFSLLLQVADRENAQIIHSRLGNLSKNKLNYIQQNWTAIAASMKTSLPKGSSPERAAEFIDQMATNELVKRGAHLATVRGQHNEPISAPVRTPQTAHQTPINQVTENLAPQTPSSSGSSKRSARELDDEFATPNSTPPKAYQVNTEIEYDNAQLNKNIAKYREKGYDLTVSDSGVKVVDSDGHFQKGPSKTMQKYKTILKKTKEVVGKGITQKKRAKKQTGPKFVPCHGNRHKKPIRFMLGSGAFEPEIPDVKYSKKDTTWLKVNKFMLNMTRLRSETPQLELKWLTSRHRRFPLETISKDVASIIDNIATQDSLNKAAFDALSREDKDKVTTFADACHIDIGINTVEELEKHVAILACEIKAGNGAAKQQLKRMLAKAIMQKQISQQAGLDWLIAV